METATVTPAEIEAIRGLAASSFPQIRSIKFILRDEDIGENEKPYESLYLLADSGGKMTPEDMDDFEDRLEAETGILIELQDDNCLMGPPAYAQN